MRCGKRRGERAWETLHQLLPAEPRGSLQTYILPSSPTRGLSKNVRKLICFHLRFLRKCILRGFDTHFLIVLSVIFVLGKAQADTIEEQRALRHWIPLRVLKISSQGETSQPIKVAICTEFSLFSHRAKSCTVMVWHEETDMEERY